MMPATKRSEELPSTLRRSSEKAQRTWAEAHDSAVETYGEGRQAHQTAYAALKHSFEKRGDHWVPKAGSTKQELLERARKLDVRGRSRMSKSELADAIASKQRRR